MAAVDDIPEYFGSGEELYINMVNCLTEIRKLSINKDGG